LQWYLRQTFLSLLIRPPKSIFAYNLKVILFIHPPSRSLKSSQTVCHWESGRSPDIRVGDLSKVAGALGCRQRDLLAPVEAPIQPLHPRPKRRRRLVSHLDARR
jgi:hypothetical protein